MNYKIKNSFTDKKVYSSKEAVLEAGYIFKWDNKDGSFTVESNGVLFVVKQVRS